MQILLASLSIMSMLSLVFVVAPTIPPESKTEDAFGYAYGAIVGFHLAVMVATGGNLVSQVARRLCKKSGGK